MLTFWSKMRITTSLVLISFLLSLVPLQVVQAIPGVPGNLFGFVDGEMVWDSSFNQNNQTFTLGDGRFESGFEVQKSFLDRSNPATAKVYNVTLAIKSISTHNRCVTTGEGAQTVVNLLTGRDFEEGSYDPDNT